MFRMWEDKQMMPEPVTYSHSLKLEETAKGVRISVHVYTNDNDMAIEESYIK